MAKPFISLGKGFRRAVFAVLETRGAPWIMRGSFMRLVSSLAGAVTGLDGDGRWMGRIRLTFLDNSAVITGEIWLAAAAWREESGTGCPPQVVRGVREEVGSGSTGEDGAAASVAF